MVVKAKLIHKVVFGIIVSATAIAPAHHDKPQKNVVQVSTWHQESQK